MKKNVFKYVMLVIILLIAALYSYGDWPRPIYDTTIGSNSYEISMNLVGNTVVEQTFECTDNGWNGVTAKFVHAQGASVGRYVWEIKNEKDALVGEGVIDETSFPVEKKLFSNKQTDFVTMKFPKQAGCKGQKYTLTITGDSVAENESVAVYFTEKGAGQQSLTIAGEQYEKAIILKMNFSRLNAETMIVFLGLAIYVWMFIRFMYKLFS